MVFAQQLPILRRSRGLSQEALAERLQVSRQAVAKWEGGQCLPELNTLVAVAELFQTSLDRLVREIDTCSTVKPTLPVADAVAEFLVRAKQATYAGKGPEAASSRPGSHDLHYAEGNLFYLDTYVGSSSFAGEEALWDDGNPFWAMNYVGRVTGEGFSGDFLKESLALATPELPYRGPRHYAAGELTYVMSVAGNFDWFNGFEEIFCMGRPVYECRFHGGRVG